MLCPHSCVRAMMSVELFLAKSQHSWMAAATISTISFKIKGSAENVAVREGPFLGAIGTKLRQQQLGSRGRYRSNNHILRRHLLKIIASQRSLTGNLIRWTPILNRISDILSSILLSVMFGCYAIAHVQ